MLFSYLEQLDRFFYLVFSGNQPILDLPHLVVDYASLPRFRKKAYLKLKKQVLVITNYRPDQQQSMLRFGNLLTSNKNSNKSLDIEESYPTPVFRKICPIGKLRKWAAYVDKYLLFPKRLKRELKSRKDPLHLIHIIDHSNATLPTQAKQDNSGEENHNLP